MEWPELRTVVVLGVPNVLSPNRMRDKLLVHFQRARSGGGDVEEIQQLDHVTGGVLITFDQQHGVEPQLFLPVL